LTKPLSVIDLVANQKFVTDCIHFRRANVRAL
jgi:hypothetical protein